MTDCGFDVIELIVAIIAPIVFLLVTNFMGRKSMDINEDIKNVVAALIAGIIMVVFAFAIRVGTGVCSYST